MPETTTWLRRNGEAIVVGLIVSAIWAGIAFLFHEGHPWAVPLFYGLVAASSALIAYFAFVLTKRIPKPKIIPTVDNIESCVRTWLDSHKVTVKIDPYQDCYFRYRITLDSGCYLTILRSRTDYQEYVQIWCDLGFKGEEGKNALKSFTEAEKAQIMFDIKTELARAKVGYSGLVDPPEDFKLFQRVPIYPTLNEFVFMVMVGNIEAARSLVLLMFLKPQLVKQIKLHLTSDTPMSEPPKV